MNVTRSVVGGCVLLCGLVSASHAASFYERGHGDFRPSYDGSALDLFFEGDASTVIDGVPLGNGQPPEDYIFDSTELVTIVPDNPQTRLTFPFDFPQLGITTGGEAWVLSQSNQQVVQPFLGFSGESLPNGVFSSAVEFELVDFSGPGDFALWQTGSFGGRTFYFVSNDGISSADALSVPVGSHAHYNWGFATPGVYELTFQASVDLLSGGFAMSAPETFTFNVVPEPASLIFLMVGGAILSRRR